MPNSAQQSSSAGFVFLKHGRFASQSYPSQPQRESLTERPASVVSPPQPVAGSKGGQRPRSGVVQEKVALTSDPKASLQPASAPNGQRPRAAMSKNARGQNSHTRQRNKVPFTLHVDPILKAAVKRQAETDNISASECGSALLEAMVRQTIHQQQAATLETALEAIIDRKFRERDDRIASLLIHNLLSSERTLFIVSQLLNLTPGLTPAIIAQLLDKAKTDARRKIAKRNPQLKEIIKELKEIILSAEEDKEEKSKPPK